MSRDAFPGFRVALALFVLSQLIATLVAAGLDVVGAPSPLAESVGLLVGVAAAIGICLVRNERPGAELLFLRPAPIGTLLVVPLSVLGLLTLQGLLNAWLVSVWPEPEWFRSLYEGMFEGSPAIILARVAVVAPLTEELLVRGAFLSAFARRHGGGRAILLSSLVFAVIHANPWQAVPAFSAGLLFGWWTLRTGSLLPALFGHALGNALIAALDIWPEWFSPGADALAGGSVAGEVTVGVTLLALGILASRRLFRSRSRTIGV